jgi:radical SAM protein with 4Fe4S-binding SPASM domain
MKTSSWQVLSEKFKTKRIPIIVSIALTNQCNLSCVHCYLNEKHTKLNHELNLEELKQLLLQLKLVGTIKLCITGGEPLLYPDWWELLLWASREHQFSILLLSNGTLINQQTAYQLSLLSNIDVQVSLYGSTAPTHEHITQVAGSFQKTIEALFWLKEYKVSTTISWTLLNLNANDFYNGKKLAYDLDIPFRYSYIIYPSLNNQGKPEQYRIRDNQFEYLFKNNYSTQINEDHQSIHQTELCESKEPICHAGLTNAHITSTGMVTPCPALPIPCGSIREHSFIDIWRNSSRLKEIRQLNHIEQCEICVYKMNCRRCLALNYLENKENLTKPANESCRLTHLSIKKLAVTSCI